MNTPQILAPAGDKNSFLAAVAAGADAVYCGLKIFSARMEAGNFSIEELARLTKLAQSKNIKTYIAFNSLIKDNELEKVSKILLKLCRYVNFDALIVQDPAILPLAKAAGYENQFHLSTLGNCTFPKGLETARQFGFQKVVLPREFTIDDIKSMARNVPDGIELEIFVHGALCYSISGRCYWSSWFGGKSALRGRCVQPCRRIYSQQGQKKRYFSCLDFSADVLAKILKDIPSVTTWKIEGRKKSPHYVYYTAKAYRLLRDDPKRKKEALSYLDDAMGRPFTHYNLLTQRKMNPLDHQSETGSGLFAGRIRNPAAPWFISREALFPGDLLRIGYEDDAHHDIQKVTRAIPRKGKFYLSRKNNNHIRKGTPVYLIDRRGKELVEALDRLEKELNLIAGTEIRPAAGVYRPPAIKAPKRSKHTDMKLSRSSLPRQVSKSLSGKWISSRGYRNQPVPDEWLWLDPLIFPDEEAFCSRYIQKALNKGAKNFVINAPWQLSFFRQPKRLNIWAGPFCNVANSAAIQLFAEKGISGVFASPELDRASFIALPPKSPLPMGIIIHGNWPLGISKIISNELKTDKPFQSPMGEAAWITKRNNSYYTFPNWLLDLRPKKDELIKAGYTLFVEMKENTPKGIRIKKRPGLWNWDLKLL